MNTASGPAAWTGTPTKSRARPSVHQGCVEGQVEGALGRGERRGVGWLWKARLGTRPGQHHWHPFGLQMPPWGHLGLGQGVAESGTGSLHCLFWPTKGREQSLTHSSPAMSLPSSLWLEPLCKCVRAPCKSVEDGRLSVLRARHPEDEH